VADSGNEASHLLPPLTPPAQSSVEPPDPTKQVLFLFDPQFDYTPYVRNNNISNLSFCQQRGHQPES